MGCDQVRRRLKGIIGMPHNLLRKAAKEVKNAGSGPLVLADGLIIHEEIHVGAVSIHRRDPLRKFFRREREPFPIFRA